MNFDIKTRVNWIIAVVTVSLGIFFDQLTKYLAAKSLVPGNPVEIIPNFLNLGIVRNKGAAFGVGSGWDPFWQKFLFLGVSIVTIVVIGYMLYRSVGRSRVIIVAIALILGGAIGNVYDRLFYGYVVDFIEVHYKRFHWPNFNFADTIICVGVGLYLLYSLFLSKRGTGRSKV